VIQNGILYLEILSAITLLGALATAALRRLRSPGSRVASVIAVFTGLVEATGGLVAGLDGAQLRFPDPGQRAIETFYTDLSHRDFLGAWNLIHSSRKAYLEKHNFTEPDFAALYDTTQEYRNVHVRLDKKEGAERIYWVTFDVKDRIPRSTYFHAKSERLDEIIKEGLLDGNGVFDRVVSDLATNYKVTNSDAENIKQLLSNQQNVLCDPMTIVDLANESKLSRITPGVEDEVWSHYIQHLTVENDSGEWKITNGLQRPVLRGWYLSGEVPTE